LTGVQGVERFCQARTQNGDSKQTSMERAEDLKRKFKTNKQLENELGRVWPTQKRGGGGQSMERDKSSRGGETLKG